MARQGISFEQVCAAATALAGEGLQPTIKAVRERLGSGSPNTIHEHLKRWRDVHPSTTMAAPELPQALTAAIAAAIEHAAMQARQEIEERLAQANAESDELTAYGSALESERDELAEKLVAMTRERDMEIGRAQQQATELVSAQQRIEIEQKAAEAARVELAKARLIEQAQSERRAEQFAEIERLRGALAEAQKGRAVAEQQAAVLVAKLEAMAERARSAEARANLLEKQVISFAAPGSPGNMSGASTAGPVAQASSDESKR